MVIVHVLFTLICCHGTIYVICTVVFMIATSDVTRELSQWKTLQFCSKLFF